MVDKSLLARKVAAIRDAVARITGVLPSTAEAFAADRTIREVVTFNLFVALQDAIALALVRCPSRLGHLAAVGPMGAVRVDVARGPDSLRPRPLFFRLVGQ